MNKQTKVVTAILRKDAQPRSDKVSPQVNRKYDPTPNMVDTRQKLRVHHSLTPSRFRRGDWVIDAAEALEKTGVPVDHMARQVVDVERHDTGWMVGVELCEGRYEHECQYILLEHADDWTPNCNKGTFFWKKSPATY